jgi:hypothetical protein
VRRVAQTQTFPTICDHLLAELPGVSYGMNVIDSPGFSHVKSDTSCTSLFTRQQCVVPHWGGVLVPLVYGNLIQTA